MTTQTRTKRFAGIPTNYPALMAMLPLRPIHDDVDAENATEIIDAMAGHDLTGDQEDYLDVLSTLLDEYETERHPVRLAANKPLTNLRRLLEDHGMNASDLGRLLGHRALGSKILRRTRRLNLTHIRKLMKHFALDATAFI